MQSRDLMPGAAPVMEDATGSLRSLQILSRSHEFAFISYAPPRLLSQPLSQRAPLERDADDLRDRDDEQPQIVIEYGSGVSEKEAADFVQRTL
ncbi:unnamed protein product, partial [Dibothriocephalus latus]